MSSGEFDLEKYLEFSYTDDPSNFPDGKKRNYGNKYGEIKEYLENEVHPLVQVGSLLADGVDKGLLTDHGVGHIQTVIKRASSLVGKAENISPYETFILLCAIQFHDVGNIFGREGHEEQHAKIMKDIEIYFLDMVERKIILDIANAHGGKTGSGSKDKISLLQASSLYCNQSIRNRYLAAIVKFSDELAEEKSRSARYGLKLPSFPESSRVYHQYAEALHTVKINHENKSIKLAFFLDDKLAQSKSGKGDKKVYLIDEIYERTIKTHMERLYCARFMKPLIDIESIQVEIRIYSSNKEYSEELESIEFTLEETGYPDYPKNGILDLCPELIDYNGKSVKEKISKNGKLK